MKTIELKKIIPLISDDENKNVSIVSNQKWFLSLKCLKLHFTYQYTLLSYISGIDFVGKTYRFVVVND